jgi:hypothetical protein
MSDTIGAMRLLVAITLLAACADDPELHVSVTNPQGLAIASTTVTDYESSMLSCDDVEFSRVSADELTAVAVTSETIGTDGKPTGALTGISRTDPKVIVARAFDAAGTLLAEGCAEQGVVSGNVTVSITTETAATASIALPDPAAADQTQVIVTATDPSGMLIDNRPVSWSVYGPAGSTPAVMPNVTIASDGVWEATAPTCTSGGIAKLHPVPPGIVGGYAVQMRVAWASELPPAFTGLTGSGLGLTPFVPPTGSQRYCAARVEGATRRLDCLDGSGVNVVAREFEVMLADGKTTLALMQSQTLTPEAIAIVSVPNGSDRDVYAITTRGHIIPVFPRPNQPVDDNYPVCGATCATPVDDAMVVPPCDTTPGQLLLHVTGVPAAQQIEAMPATGGPHTTLPLQVMPVDTDVALDNAGCVATLTAQTKQVISVHQGVRVAADLVASATRIYFDCNGGSCSSMAVLLGAGVGFLTGNEPRIIVASVDATGVVVVQAVFAQGGTGGHQLVQRVRYPAVSVPDHIVVGQYDTDSMADMLWNVTNKRGNPTTLEVAYARLVGTQPLEALSAAVPFVVDDLLSIDLVGVSMPDGLDDIVITGSVPGIGHGIVVIPASVPTAPISLAADPTCAP